MLVLVLQFQFAQRERQQVADGHVRQHELGCLVRHGGADWKLEVIIHQEAQVNEKRDAG